MAVYESKYNTPLQNDLENMGLNQRSAGRYFGRTDKTIRNYVSGRSTADKSMLMIIEYIKEFPERKADFDRISERLEREQTQQD